MQVNKAEITHLMDMFVTFTTEGLAFLYTSMATFSSSGVSIARASCMGAESCIRRGAACTAARGAEEARALGGRHIYRGAPFHVRSWGEAADVYCLGSAMKSNRG